MPSNLICLLTVCESLFFCLNVVLPYHETKLYVRILSIIDLYAIVTVCTNVKTPEFSKTTKPLSCLLIDGLYVIFKVKVIINDYS